MFLNKTIKINVTLETVKRLGENILAPKIFN